MLESRGKPLARACLQKDLLVGCAVACGQGVAAIQDGEEGGHAFRCCGFVGIVNDFPRTLLAAKVYPSDKWLLQDRAELRSVRRACSGQVALGIAAVPRWRTACATRSRAGCFPRDDLPHSIQPLLSSQSERNVIGWKVVMKPVLIALLLLPQAVAAESGAGWSYAGATGPENWGTLSKEYAICGLGQRQSPIDLEDAAGTGRLKASYAAVPLSILNNGHTVQVAGEQGGGFDENGGRYDLVQGHFHSPSEHAVDGTTYPLELHLVHRSAAGYLGVIGVFIEEGAANPALAPIISNAPAKAGGPVTIPGATFDVAELLPKNVAHHHYSGSLTTPPCSEDVAWIVLDQPITASAEQIGALSAIMGENARPLQKVEAMPAAEPAN